MPLTPSRRVFGAALPGLVVSVALLASLGGVTAGCTREETTEGRVRPSDKSARLAPLGVAYMTAVPRAGLLLAPSSRASKEQATFLVGRIQPANTPLEMLLGDGDRPLLNNGLCPPD